MIFTRYLFRNLLLATLFTAITLASIVMLTQSIRFLELIVESGASSLSFWIVTLLALPRFFEIILPLALTIGVIFLYNRMSTDSEMVVAKAAGLSPLQLAKPALYLAGVVTLLMFFITAWLAPASLSSMQKMRVTIKAQYSGMILREGIFNTVGKNLTVYIRERGANGELNDLMIHDTRDPAHPVTILAKRGVILSVDSGQQVLVYDGTRLDINDKSGALNNLQFQRYTIDLPDSDPVRQRWREPDERTLYELLNPDAETLQRPAAAHMFRLEALRRMISPFLSFTFTLVSLVFMVIGPVDRRGQGKRIVWALGATIVLQAIYLGLFNMAQKSYLGLALMSGVIFLPSAAALFMLSPYSDIIRHNWLYRGEKQGASA